VSAAYVYVSIVTFEGATEERGYRHPARVQVPLVVASSASGCGNGLSYLWNEGLVCAFGGPQEYADAESTVSFCRPCVIVLFFFSLQSPLSLSPFLPLTVGGGGIAAFAFRTFLFVWFGEDEFWGKVGNLFSVSFRSNKSQILPSQQTSTYLGLGQATLL